MTRLLTASFARLWREKLFWLACIFMCGGGVLAWANYRGAMRNGGEDLFVEDMMFNMLPMIGLVVAIFACMRLGTEFDEHTVRNKLMVGCSRTQVYFAEYLTTLAASLILLAVMLASSTLTGWLLLEKFRYPGADIAFWILCCVLMVAVFSAINVGLAMNIQNKAVAVVVSMVVFLGLLLLASFCINALAEGEKIYSSVVITMDGVQTGELVDNPAYVDGVRRTVYEYIADGLPTGQTIQLNNLDCERAARWPALSAAMLAIATLAGYLPFRKRDIR